MRTIHQRYEDGPRPGPPPNQIRPYLLFAWQLVKKVATFLAILIVVTWAMLSIIEVLK